MAEKNASVQEEKWDIVIKPKDKLLTVDFKELWSYKDLCLLFVKRNIITQYKQTPETLEEIQESEKRYIEAYHQHPFATDWRYFWGTIGNILFKHKRSH